MQYFPAQKLVQIRAMFLLHTLHRAPMMQDPDKIQRDPAPECTILYME